MSSLSSTFASTASVRIPGAYAIPRNTPGAITVGTPVVGTAATPTSVSVVTSPLKISCERPDAFTYFGCSPKVTLAGGSVRVYTTAGGYTNSSNSPWSAEFTLDSANGVFEVIYKGDLAGGVTVVVDGEYVSTARPTFRAASSDGSTYVAPISGLGTGRRHIRLLFEPATVFHGIIVGSADGVRAAPRRSRRMVVIGDSFTEPTTSDSGGVWRYGWVQYLGDALGLDPWSCGSGGTGYLNPSTGGKVKFRDRLADVVAAAPDVVLWAGGINDYASYTAADIGTEAAACYAALKAALPACRQIVVSPFYPKGNAMYPLALLAARDTIKAAALAAGLSYVDALELPPSTQITGTVQGATSVGATTITSDVSFPAGAWVRIGSGASTDIRVVASVSGSGPYTLTVAQSGQNLLAAHAVGEPIVQTGPGWVTGTGTQASPASNGTGDRYTGSDATHPTVQGHVNLALALLPQIAPLIH